PGNCGPLATASNHEEEPAMAVTRLKIFALVSAVAMLPAAHSTLAQGAPQKASAQLMVVGRSRLESGPITEDEIGPEAQEADEGGGVRWCVTGAMSWARPSAAHIPRVDGTAFTNLDAGFSGFNGLTHRDSRLADNGNQFSVEPPDQGLAVGAGFIVEVV